jgi:hypothetical protein
LYINTGLGNESLRIFRNGFHIEKFSYDEIMNLPWLLTREIRAQINDDHFLFWAWTVHVVYDCLIKRSIPMPDWLRSDNWFDSFLSLVSLSLSIENISQLDPGSAIWYVLRYQHIISGPLSYAVLEGLLRRKNRNFVYNDGSAHTPFPKYDSKGKAISCYKINGCLNRIRDSIRLFENKTCCPRGRRCIGLDAIKDEIFNLYVGTKDAYDLIDDWRNDLVHGNKYWNNRVATILNLMCLLILDEIGPSSYDNNLSYFQATLEFKRRNASINYGRYDIYLPGP